MYTTRAGKDVLEAQGVHKCWPMLVSVSLVLLFLSRAIYNIIAVRLSSVHVFGDGSTFTTDMVSLVQLIDILEPCVFMLVAYDLGD